MKKVKIMFDGSVYDEYVKVVREYNTLEKKFEDLNKQKESIKVPLTLLRDVMAVLHKKYSGLEKFYPEGMSINQQISFIEQLARMTHEPDPEFIPLCTELNRLLVEASDD